MEIIMNLLSIFSDKWKFKLWHYMVEEARIEIDASELDELISIANKMKIDFHDALKEFFSPISIIIYTFTSILLLFGNFWFFAGYSIAIAFAFVIYDRANNFQKQTKLITNLIKDKFLERINSLEEQIQDETKRITLLRQQMQEKTK